MGDKEDTMENSPRNGSSGKEVDETGDLELDTFTTSLKEDASKAKRPAKWYQFESVCHRQNFIQTSCVYFNFMMLGWNYGVLGTAFQDLQLVLNTNVKQTSLIFTMNSVGYMTGSTCLGYIYDRVDNKLVLLGLTSIGIAILSAVVPWCTNYWVFLVVRVLTGLCCGGQDSGGNAKVASCWGTGGAQYMQALHFAYAFGGIISPLVTSLFMAPRIYDTSLVNGSDVTTPFGLDERFTENSSLGETTTMITTTSMRGDLVTDIVQDTMQMDGSMRKYGETKIHIIFLITAFITALAGCCYLLLYFLGFGHVSPYYNDKKSGNNGIKSNKDPSKVTQYPRLNTARTAFFFVCLAVCMITYGTVECKLQSFLMPFLIMQLDWEKRQCAYAISLLWAFFGLGRLCGVPISRYMSPGKILTTFMSSAMLFCFVMFLGAYFHINVLIWIAVPLSGWSISPLYASYLIWVDENVMKLSGKLVGRVCLFASIGFLVDPLYIGVLMENISPLFFTYVQMAGIALGLLAFCVLVILARHLNVHQKLNIVDNTG